MTSLPARGWNSQWFVPTGEQQQVLQSPATALIISALAGTGKTTTLCMKACHLLAGLGPEARILVLAYSRAGVTALRDRMLKLHGAVPASLEILTMEQLSEQVLRAQGDPVIRLQDPVRRRLLILQAQQALRQELTRSPDPGADAVLERDVDIDAFLAFEALAKKKRLDKQCDDAGGDLRAFCEEQDLDYGLYRLLRHYERMRVGLGHEPRFYADGDCSLELCRQLDLLDWDQPCEWLQGRYGAVLFDELHDLDESALTILRKLVQSHNGVFVGAGDFNQHIHEGSFSVFGGALQHIRASLPQDTEVLRIHTTRRFGAEICAALNPLFGVEFASVAQSADSFVHGTYDTDAQCAQQLVELQAQITQGWGGLHGDKSQHSALNVVLRNPQDSILLEWVFGHEGVHYGCQGMSAFYLRREVALVLCLLWALEGSPVGRPLTPGILGAAIQGLLHYGRRAVRHGTVDPDVLAQGQFDESGWTDRPGASESLQLGATLHGDVAQMRRYIQHGTLDRSAPPLADACAQVLALAPALCADAGALCSHPLVRRIFEEAPINGQERQACLASLGQVAALAQGMPVSEFLGRLTLVATSSIEMHLRKEPVTLRLMSVEACKGREFTFVAVPFVERGRFPGAASHQESYRERNMLYVALTRARTALWLLESAARPVTPGPV
ncbi:UvrD-helicase domain-containing protein [Acidovorax sp. FJL06]|uniref:UvrD-helicase domain-containing protein n=1 Tax=Acidovorax sp. FJL06 TaxID=2153365 RepID=UPI000F57365A|nr:UvrD-helicase domain-containing protein [Acidovorax sp. FJL06]RQO83148.1 ATP-dependent helicase [Acidovorax sp. FJL06]